MSTRINFSFVYSLKSVYIYMLVCYSIKGKKTLQLIRRCIYFEFNRLDSFR
jgi:hypothetical protein